MKLFVAKFEIRSGEEGCGSYISVLSDGQQYYVTDTDGCDLRWFNQRQSALDWAKDKALNYFE